MLSKRFFAWVGVGVLSVATIPALAAPHLARLAARKAPAATAVKKSTTAAKPAPMAKTPVKAVAGKNVAKVTPAAHKVSVVPAKKTATKTATRTGTKTATKASTRTSGRVAASRHTNLTHGAAKKATPAATATKLLH